MTAAIVLGDINPQEIDVDLAFNQALPEQLENPNIPCIECGDSGDVERNNWDHHYYDGDTTEKKYFPPACIQAARERLGEIPPVVQAIGAWDEGRMDEFPEFREIQVIFGGMLLDVKNVMEQAKKGISLCQKWLRGNFVPTLEEEKWAKIKREYDEYIENELEKVEFVDTLGGRAIAYVESPFWGTLREIQQRLDDDDIVIVRNPEGGKITIALNPQGPGDLKFVCDLLNKIDPGWGGPITGKIIGSPHKGSRLTLYDAVQIVRLFM
jgi:hypothetical protein